MAISLVIKLNSYIASGNKTIFPEGNLAKCFKSLKKGVHYLS